jgi:hypothetical protein
VRLWEAEISDFEIIGIDPPTAEHWYDPFVPETVFNDHQSYFQYNICLPEPLWFDQTQGTIYWLMISAVVQDPQTTRWGWKSSLDHFNDDAVAGLYDDVIEWAELYEPTPVLSNGFGAAFDRNGWFVEGGGQDAFGAGWYEYAEWYNIWFYDHPFDDERLKYIWIVFDALPNDDPQFPWYVVMTANWSTDEWSTNPPPGTPIPPETPPLPGVDEGLYIGRGAPDSIWQPSGQYVYELEIPDYNPEWVSVDIRAMSTTISGVIYHQCTRSMDMSFVITGGADELGACCYDDPAGLGPTCAEMTLADCDAEGGVWLGAGTTCQAEEACCLPDGSCIWVDPVCCGQAYGGTPQGPGTVCQAPQACCFPDGTCDMYDPLCCFEQGGIPQGSGSQCQGFQACCFPDGTCRMMDALCCVAESGEPQGVGSVCTEPQACCMPDLSCWMMDPLCCVAEGGVPQGVGSVCSDPEACCLPDLSCRMADPLCCARAGGTPMGPGTICTDHQACCLPSGECRNLDPLCCLVLGGEPQGPGTVCTVPEACCLPGGECANLDPLCCLMFGGEPAGPGTVCTAPRACCFQDGAICETLDPACCIAQGGEPKADQPTCLGDADANHIDDACESEYCCGLYDPDNRTGNVDYDPDNFKDISDILMLARYALLGGERPPCIAEANTDGDPDCFTDISDILWLARYSLLGGELPAFCLPQCEP